MGDDLQQGAEIDALPPQSVTSEKTSLRQVPALHKSPVFEVVPGHRNVDIGGGAFDLGTEYLANERGVESHVYDPFNRPFEHNKEVVTRFKKDPAHTATVANVLNVIPEREHRIGAIKHAFELTRPDGKAYFAIYEGDRSGKGGTTSKGWQNNRPAAGYMDEVAEVFPHVERKGNIIIGHKERPHKSSGGIIKQKPQAADYIEEGSMKHTHIHPDTGAYISAVTRPKGKRSASITDLYVPEEHRNKGIGKMLLSSMMDQFPSLQGQVSSKVAAKNAYQAGRRMAGNESASLEDIYKKIDEDSSVNMWTHKAEGGSVDLSQYQEQTPFGLYSHAAETAAALPQAKGTPDQFKAMLLKQGVKPAEIEHSQYDDIFADRPSVTKDELVQHFRQRMPRIKEHILGGDLTEEQKQHANAIQDKFKSLMAEAQSHRDNQPLNTPERQEAQKKLEKLLSQMYETLKTEVPEWEDIIYREQPKFEQYTLPGGENYREHLLQLERGENSYEAKAGHAYRRKSQLVDEHDRLPPGDPRGPEMSQQIVALQQEYNRLLDMATKHDVKPYSSNHWAQDNVLAHLRMKDRVGPNGEKVLHVDEIQSDWGQSGRGGNFQDLSAKENYSQFLNDMRQKLIDRTKQALIDNNIPSEKHATALEGATKDINKLRPEALANLLDMNEEHEQALDRIRKFNNGVPNGPYVTNTAAWTDLALKRALHEAAKGGYDKIAFTPGDVHVDRYDLSNYVNSIHAFPQENGKIHINLHDDENPDDYPIERMRDIDPKELHKYVGKEVADRILSRIEFPVRKEYWRVSHRSDDGVHVFGDKIENVDEAEKLFNSLPDHIRPTADMDVYSQRVGGKNAVLRDLDLKIGGEGMKSYYDKIVPKQLTELAKRHDKEAKVENLEMPIEGREPVTMPTLTITPKMRESILRGQRAFADGGEVEGITAYHGSPHDFDQFDISKIGTGEGAQAFGHGLYFAQAEPTAKEYRDTLTDRASNFRVGNIDMPKWVLRGIELAPDRDAAIEKHRQDFMQRLAEAEAEAKGDNQPWMASSKISAAKDILAGLDQLQQGAQLPHTRGRMYEVQINAHPDHFLDWDKPLNEQPHIYSKLGALAASNDKNFQGFHQHIVGDGNDTGSNLYRAMTDKKVLGLSAIQASKMLHDLGIRGIKYLDATSRTPPPNLDPDHIKGQIERNRAQAAQVTDEAHRADLDDDHQILLDRLKRAEKQISRNYVVFDDKLVNVKRKYAFGGTV